MAESRWHQTVVWTQRRHEKTCFNTDWTMCSNVDSTEPGAVAVRYGRVVFDVVGGIIVAIPASMAVGGIAIVGWMSGRWGGIGNMILRRLLHREWLHTSVSIYLRFFSALLDNDRGRLLSIFLRECVSDAKLSEKQYQKNRRKAKSQRYPIDDFFRLRCFIIDLTSRLRQAVDDEFSLGFLFAHYLFTFSFCYASIEKIRMSWRLC